MRPGAAGWVTDCGGLGDRVRRVGDRAATVSAPSSVRHEGRPDTTCETVSSPPTPLSVAIAVTRDTMPVRWWEGPPVVGRRGLAARQILRRGRHHRQPAIGVIARLDGGRMPVRWWEGPPVVGRRGLAARQSHSRRRNHRQPAIGVIPRVYGGGCMFGQRGGGGAAPRGKGVGWHGGYWTGTAGSGCLAWSHLVVLWRRVSSQHTKTRVFLPTLLSGRDRKAHTAEASVTKCRRLACFFCRTTAHILVE